ncbi:MAG: FkbM family methyltransferase [Smithella sp.]|nr:FkbM family methyltransferase [Smithella sp.]
MLKRIFGGKKISPPESTSIGMDAALSGLKRRGYVPVVVYDIGAADGGWSRQAMKYWPNAGFVCFEPLVERKVALEQLKKDFPGKVNFQACGVGDTDGALSFGVTEFLWDSSFAYSGASARSVPIHKLDTLIKQGVIPSPSFIKIDVQGYEKRVLDGGELAMKSADLILMECAFFKFCKDMRTLDVTIAYMAERNFIPYEFADYLRRPLDGAMGQCDILFIKKDHPLVSNPQWG